MGDNMTPFIAVIAVLGVTNVLLGLLAITCGIALCYCKRRRIATVTDKTWYVDCSF